MATKEEILKKLIEAVVEYEEDDCADAAQEALDLGLLTQVVSKENLKDSCINELRKLTAISADALIESRRMLKPSLKKMREYIDEGFEGIIRCLHGMRKPS